MQIASAEPVLRDLFAIDAAPPRPTNLMGAGADLLLARVRAAVEDEYTIAGELGRGGMAAVYLARDIALERRVAIKVMLPDLVGVDGIQDRFVIEARTAAHLDHPGIVTVYSVKQRNDLLFIVMKYVEGRTLEGILEDRRPLDATVVTTIVGQVAEALHFAHGEGIIHRDVKPSNIIIDTRGRPVVTDFGIAKVASERSITITGSVIGTPTYMSPEQCRGLPATAASDQYALGIMAYEMLGRKKPFDGTLFELLHMHCDQPPQPLRELAPDLDPGVEAAVMRMLAKNPRERWPSLADVARELGRFSEQRHRQSDVRAAIAELAREADSDGTVAVPGRHDPSHAATELATTPPPQLVITPSTPTIEVGESIQLRTSESSGASLVGVKLQWKSEDATVASVDENGLLFGKSVGLAKITAAAGGALGRVAVNVRAPRVDTVVVTPQYPALTLGDDLPLVATLLDARGQAITGQAVVWTSSDVRVCAVSQQGRAIAVGAGIATLTAQAGGVNGAAHARVRLPEVERVVVTPGEIAMEVEEARSLEAMVFGAFDREITGRPVTWRSTVPLVATVDASGTVAGIASGTAAIIAVCEGKEGLASVSVRAQSVVAVRIQPAQLQLEVGRSLQLSGIGEDRVGRTVSGRGIDWQSDDERVALVDASGKVHGVSEGQTRVRAIAGGVTSAIAVTVVVRPVAQLRIEPHASALTVGESLILEATALDADGLTLPGREIVWTSSNPDVVVVDPTGRCEARRAGNVRITATRDRATTATKLTSHAFAVAGVIPTEPEAVRESVATAPVGGKTGRWLLAGASVVGIGLIAMFALRGHGGTAPAPISPVATSTPADIAPAPSVPSPLPSTPTVAAVTPSTPAGRSADTTTTKRAGTRTAANPAGRANTTAPASNQPPPVTASSPPPGGGAVASIAPVLAGRAADPPRGRVDTIIPAPPISAPPVSAPPPAQSAATAASKPTTSTPTGGERGAGDPAAVRAALCTAAAAPAAALNTVLSANTLSSIDALYQPKDAEDTRSKAAMLKELKGLADLRAASRIVRNEPAGDSCDWLMVIDFTGTSFVGAPKKASWQIRVQLESAGSASRVKRLFGATKP